MHTLPVRLHVPHTHTFFALSFVTSRLPGSLHTYTFLTAHCLTSFLLPPLPHPLPLVLPATHVPHVHAHLVCHHHVHTATAPHTFWVHTHVLHYLIISPQHLLPRSRSPAVPAITCTVHARSFCWVPAATSLVSPLHRILPLILPPHTHTTSHTCLTRLVHILHLHTTTTPHVPGFRSPLGYSFLDYTHLTVPGWLDSHPGFVTFTPRSPPCGFTRFAVWILHVTTSHVLPRLLPGYTLDHCHHTPFCVTRSLPFCAHALFSLPVFCTLHTSLVAAASPHCTAVAFCLVLRVHCHCCAPARTAAPPPPACALFTPHLCRCIGSHCARSTLPLWFGCISLPPTSHVPFGFLPPHCRFAPLRLRTSARSRFWLLPHMLRTHGCLASRFCTAYASHCRTRTARYHAAHTTARLRTTHVYCHYYHTCTYCVYLFCLRILRSWTRYRFCFSRWIPAVPHTYTFCVGYVPASLGSLHLGSLVRFTTSPAPSACCTAAPLTLTDRHCLCTSHLCTTWFGCTPRTCYAARSRFTASACVLHHRTTVARSSPRFSCRTCTHAPPGSAVH